MALAHRLKGLNNSRFFVMMGDETSKGQVWEAVMTADAIIFMRILLINRNIFQGTAQQLMYEFRSTC